MADIFISYVHDDNPIAHQIAQGLEAAGYSTWHYGQDALPGTDYLETIGQVIDAAKAFLIIISPKSVQSAQVYRELVRASEKDKALFPLLHGIEHEEFQDLAPKWRQAMGATTSIGIPSEGVAAIMPRLLAGLSKVGIQPSGEAGVPERPIPSPQPRPRLAAPDNEPAPRRAVSIWAVAVLGLVAIAAAVGITLALTHYAGTPPTTPTTVSSGALAATETPALTATPPHPVNSVVATQPVPPTQAPGITQPAPPAAQPTLAPSPTPASALEVHAAQVALLDNYDARQIAWSPDGQWIAIRSYHIHFLDAKTYKEAYSVDSVQWPSSLAFSPDGTTLAYAGEQVTFVEVGTWGDLGALAGSGGTKALAYSPDGRKLAATMGEVVKLWDLSTGKEVQTFPGTSGDAVAFSPDGKMLAAAGGAGGGEIKRWDVGTGQELAALTGHSNWIRTLDFSPDGRTLVSGSVDQSIRLWDVVAGRQLRVLKGHTGEVTGVDLTADGRLLASASWDLTVRLWDVATGREVQSLLGHTGWVQCVAFSPDGALLASGSGDGVRLWSIESGGVPVQATPTRAPAAIATPIPLSPSAISPGNVAQVAQQQTLDDSWVTQLAWSPDGRLLAGAANNNEQVRLGDAASGRQRAVLSGHSGQVNSLAFSAAGHLLACASGSEVKLGDVDAVLTAGAAGAELRTLSGHTSEVKSVAFSPDGSRLASGDGNVRLWGVTP